MTVVYLVCFIAGLLLGVRIMIAGVERPREDDPRGERTFKLSPAVIAAFGTVFGLVGYLMTRRQPGSVVTGIIWAAGLAVIAAAVTAHLVRKWWAVTPEHEVDDERYVLQGHLARVTKSIGAGVDGEVAFEVGEQRRVLPARTIDDAILDAGADVVIERIENDVAYVESWAEVEKRL
ncbi:MAG TPA: hypothetical protein VN706_20935 [Gemmatimonadaceae bacterium]|nr:hypothetical protein [Gemmatimonadaceae bacterium]